MTAGGAVRPRGLGVPGGPRRPARRHRRPRRAGSAPSATSPGRPRDCASTGKDASSCRASSMRTSTWTRRISSTRAPSEEGTLAEAIRVTAEAKRAFTVEDIQARARRLLDRAAALGTTAMRGHVEVDPIVGLRGVEAVLPLRREYADRLDLQVCAFAQEGILQAPGTEALLREALRARRRPRRRVPLQRHRRRRARGPRVRPRAGVRLRRGLPRRLRRRAGAPPRGGDRRPDGAPRLAGARRGRPPHRAGRVRRGRAGARRAAAPRGRGRRDHAAGDRPLPHGPGRHPERPPGAHAGQAASRRRRDGRGRDEQRPERLHARRQRGPAPPHVPPRRRRAHGRRRPTWRRRSTW